MEKNITKHCTYANSCRECSFFIIDQRLDNAANIWWNETCSNYIMQEYGPVTTVKIGITNEILSYNQTRCCKGQRTLFFTGIYLILLQHKAIRIGHKYKNLDRPLPTGIYLISTAKFIIIGPLENGLSQYLSEKLIFKHIFIFWYSICKIETENLVKKSLLSIIIQYQKIN